LSEAGLLVTYLSFVAGISGGKDNGLKFLSGWMGSGHNNIKQKSRIPRDALAKSGVITNGKQLA